MIKLYPSIPLFFFIFDNQMNAQQLISRNRLNKWKKFYGKNGLPFKLKIGREKEIARETEERAPIWSPHLEYAVPFSLLVISLLFLRFQFLLRWLSYFLAELDFYGRSFRARVWIFGLFGSGLCFGGVFFVCLFPK